MMADHQSIVTPVNYLSNDTPNRFEEILTKSGKELVKVNMGHFDNLCKRFQTKSNIKIKNLQGVDKRDFKLMVSYVRLLYGTEHYNNLYEIVKKHFVDIKYVKPGTIGGYFGGCLSTVDENINGCSISCAGSIPKPQHDEGWSFCDQAVIFADNKGSGYNFTILKGAVKDEDMDPCYIFVEQTDIKSFPGFDETEKSELWNMGINNIYLIGYDDNGNNYQDLYNGSISLDQIKTRETNEPRDNSHLALGIILILMIFGLLFGVGWNYINPE